MKVAFKTPLLIHSEFTAKKQAPSKNLADVSKLVTNNLKADS